MTVNRQEELNEYWESVFEGKNNISQKQKMAEIIKRLKETNYVNEHGIYENYETVLVSLPNSFKTTIKIEVAQGSDQKWRFGLHYENCKEWCCHGSLPGIFNDGYDTKNEAIVAGAEVLKERYKKLNQYIDDFVSGLDQLSLF